MKDHVGFNYIIIKHTNDPYIPQLYTMIPPNTAPHPLPSPWCNPCNIPWAEERSSEGIACVMQEQQAAHTAAWVTPALQKSVMQKNEYEYTQGNY